VVFLSLFGCSFLFIDRPALLAMLPFLLSFQILQKDGKLSKLDLLQLLLLNIIWVNLHGSWPVLILMFTYRQFFRVMILKNDNFIQSVKWFVTFSMSVLINPFGVNIFKYVFDTAIISSARHLEEWGRTTRFEVYGSQVWCYYILIIFFLLCLVKSARVSKSKLMICLSSPLVIMLVLGMQSVRNTAWAFFVFPLFINKNNFVKYVKVTEDKSLIKNIINIAVTGIIFISFIGFLPSVKPHIQKYLPENKKNVYSKNTPLLIADYLNRTNDSFPVFNEWELGSYLILKQKHPIFIDTRNIIYGEKEFNIYQAIITGKSSWEFYLSQYNIHYVVVKKSENKSLYSEISNSLNWKSALEENNIILYSKK
jgi:hypothetical protein